MGKPFLFCDVDGTFLRWQLFSYWIDGMVDGGIFPKAVIDRTRPALERYKSRTGHFSEFVRELIYAYSGEQRLKGIRVFDAVGVAEEVVIRHGKETHVFTRELARATQGFHVGRSLISGSPTVVLYPFARLHGFEKWHCYGTEHPDENGLYTGDPPKTWYDRKGEAVDALCVTNEIELRLSVAIGDSESDAAMLRKVGYPICFNPNKQLMQQARQCGWPVVLEKKDLVYIFRANRDGLKSVSIESIIPEYLVPNFKKCISETPTLLVR